MALYILSSSATVEIGNLSPKMTLFDDTGIHKNDNRGKFYKYHTFNSSFVVAGDD